VSEKILLTGASGQVGGALLQKLQNLGEVVAPKRAELDLSDAEAVRHFVREVKPRWIVNPGAYTAVDKAETERDLAYAINRDAVQAIGEEAAALGAAVISFSTDYVFPGDGDQPWVETDATGPLGVYGASKLAGEQALVASGAPHIIFRTSWVYGATGHNFLRSILRMARERETMKIVADQHGAPTWSEDLARLTVHTIQKMESAREGRSLSDTVRASGGVYHACDAGETTWFGFANEFLRLAREAEPQQRFAELVPIPSSEYPTPARRPLNSRLNCERLQRELDFKMPPWESSVAQVMEEIHRA
jgi:dTDP-4-dehydrorhamnose reductase